MRNGSDGVSRSAVCRIAMLAVCCTVATAVPTLLKAEPLTLKRAVQLALAHSTTSSIAAADEQHAAAGYAELRNSYIPQVAVGSGLGYSFGFPLSLEGSAPSIVNLNATSVLFNRSLGEGMRAAQAEQQAAALQSKDQRGQVVQDTVLSYAELNKWEQRMARLREEQEAADQFEEAVAERVKEGVDSALDRTKARLTAARVRLRKAEAEGSVDVLRERLAKLTGLPPSSIATIADSIPAFPAVKQDEDISAKVASSPAVEAAMEHARAQYLRAQAEHKAFWPTADFATQYARLARYNNYDKYFQAGSFQPNNASIGVVLRFPFLNYPQRARAQAADADALKAQKQAEAAKNQVSEQTLRLQRTVRQMEAAHEVAQLEYEIAQTNAEAVHTKMDAGTANLHDLDSARTQLSEHFVELQDTAFELERARVGLLRTTGELEGWVLGADAAANAPNP
jgi:outer membrane protein TolC